MIDPDFTKQILGIILTQEGWPKEEKLDVASLW